MNTNYMSYVKMNANLCAVNEYKKEAWTDEELCIIRKKSLEEWNEHKKYSISRGEKIVKNGYEMLNEGEKFLRRG